MENSRRGEVVLEETPRALPDNSQWTFPAPSDVHGLRWEFQADKTSTKGKDEWCDLSGDLTTTVEKNHSVEAEGGKTPPPKHGQKCRYKSGLAEICRTRPSLKETVPQKCYLDKHQGIRSAEREAGTLEVRNEFHLGGDLMGYSKKHPDKEPRKHPVGGKDGNRQKAVKRDQSIQTEGRRYQCAQCGKFFGHRQTLSKHQKIHTGEKLHKCLACGKGFTSREPLLRHQRIHTGEKPYECSQCGKCFRQRVHLMCHQKTHTGEKPFKCPECGRNFSRRDKLIRHQRIHRGQRSYAHTEPGKSFDPKTALLKHQSLYQGQ